jgi:hypothetical protein
MAMQIRATLGGADLRGKSEYLTFEQFIGSGKPLRARDRDVIFSHEEPRLKIKKRV